MAQYLLSAHTADEQTGEPMTEERMQELIKKIGELEEEMSATDALVASGRLADLDATTVVRAEGGKTLTTDGPFVEAKEHLAGFYIVKADDLDGALEWAEKTTACIGQAIEVRPFVEFELIGA